MTLCADRGLCGILTGVMCLLASVSLAASDDTPAATNASRGFFSMIGVANGQTATNTDNADYVTNMVARAGPLGGDEYADLADFWRKQPDADASPVENLTLPVEHYDNGRVRAVLHAGRAVINRNGVVWSWQVAVDLFDPVGRIDGRVEAASCLYDRSSRRGYCPEHVRLVRTNAVVTGVGMYWTMADQRMRILSEPVVQTDHGIRSAGNLLGPGRNETEARWRPSSEPATNRSDKTSSMGENK